MDGLARLSTLHAGRRRRLDGDIVDRAAERRSSRMSIRQNGGIGGAPKFPNAPAFALFSACSVSQRPAAQICSRRCSARSTAMARGGIYDQLGGGFHRYSVDAQWLVPHFEKMLYDNAQLVPLYLDAFRRDRRSRCTARSPRRRSTTSSREMTHPDGGFYSTQDADTEGEEGQDLPLAHRGDPATAPAATTPRS